MTSWPCCARSAAATDESTPPDIATTTRMVLGLPPGARHHPRFGHYRREAGEQVVHVGVAVCGSQADPDRVLGPVRRKTHGAQDVRGLERAGRAGGAGRDGNPLEIERDQERLGLDA